jgi:rubrerythrin
MFKEGKNMNFGYYDIEDLLLTAIKSEVESNKLYIEMGKKTKNGLLKDKLKFLAEEELKHREFIVEIYYNHYPGKEVKLPMKTIMPLPKFNITKDTQMSTLLNEAMNAEKNSSEFYKKLADRFEKGSKINNTLKYFADMEIGHYRLLEIEKKSIERYEEDDVYWPMVHAGP